MTEDNPFEGGSTWQIGKEVFQFRKDYPTYYPPIAAWRRENPEGTTKEFVDHLVKTGVAIRLNEHPGFASSVSGW